MYYQVRGGHSFLYLMTEEMSKRGTAEELSLEGSGRKLIAIEGNSHSVIGNIIYHLHLR